MKDKQPKILKELKKYILKGYGKRCSEYVVMCGVCEAWRAYDTLNWLYVPSKKSHK